MLSVPILAISLFFSLSVPLRHYVRDRQLDGPPLIRYLDSVEDGLLHIVANCKI
jgi:hypothetical protein